MGVDGEKILGRLFACQFRCDCLALGCFMIPMMEKFAGAEVVRTRDQKVQLLTLWWESALWTLLDVGAIYNPEIDRYDHHQRGFDQVFGRGFTTKLSSAGLVYKLRFHLVGEIDRSGRI
ncbi:hypothetical protein R1sor_017305 [Riccia sorocarpa]|uniref:Uncharacterized protein n=1 Tax=Riccia sorocarpa TaxID=122646 RepID=A0ABD3I6G0_9MARC